MMKDIEKIKGETNGEKIITKNEWMISALEELEKNTLLNMEDTPSYLYDQIFIDPTKLTPF